MNTSAILRDSDIISDVYNDEISHNPPIITTVTQKHGDGWKSECIAKIR